MKKFLILLAAVAVFAAPALSFAQTMTDYEYNRLSFGNNFANEKAKPILRNADLGLHAPVSTLALLSAIEYGARYQGMLVNVDTGLYFYDATDCGIGATSPTAVAPDDTVGCWYLMSGAADIWAALAATTPTSGASLIGIKDTAAYYTGDTVEEVLAELYTLKQNLVIPLYAGNIATLDASGGLADGLVQAADLATRSEIMDLLLNFGIVHEPVTRALTGALMPVAPADKYRAFCTADGGSFVAGKIYEYSTYDGWDSGTNVAPGQIVLAYEGGLIVGGTGLTDWDSLASKTDLTVPAAAGNIASLTADGKLEDSLIAKTGVSALLAVFADQGRQATNTAQAITTATRTLIELEDAEVTGDVTYSTDTDVFTIPAAGVYTLTMQAEFAAAAGTKRVMGFRVDSDTIEVVSITPDGTDPDLLTGYFSVYLPQSATVGLYVEQDSGGDLNITNGQMAIQRIQ